MARRELPNSALKYTIDHSPFIYVIDKTGSWRELLQDGVPIADMANDIRYFIHNGG
jgi:protein SCO1/2